MAQIIYYYKRCVVDNCHNPSNGNFAFCEPCYRIRIATQRPCSSCNTTLVNVQPQHKPMRRLLRVYCKACTNKHKQKLLELQEQENQRVAEMRLAQKNAAEAARLEALRIEHEKEMEIQRVKDEKKRVYDEKMRIRIDKIMDCPDQIRDMIYELYKELDQLETENLELKMRIH